MENLFYTISNDINRMIELSREIGYYNNEYKFIANKRDKYNYNEENAEIVRIKLHETITILDKLKNKYK